MYNNLLCLRILVYLCSTREEKPRRDELQDEGYGRKLSWDRIVSSFIEDGPVFVRPKEKDRRTLFQHHGQRDWVSGPRTEAEGLGFRTTDRGRGTGFQDHGQRQKHG